MHALTDIHNSLIYSRISPVTEHISKTNLAELQADLYNYHQKP